jgi:hypothetical protein
MACTPQRCYYDKEVMEDEMGGACDLHGGDEKCVQNFGWKI